MMSKEAMKRTVDRIKSTFWEGYLPEPDKRQQALDKKAENARELGLDYEPAKDNSNYRFDPPGLDPLYTPPQPAQQEPVAWRWSESNGQRWFDWTVDWSHHDKAKSMGFPIEYAYTSPPAQRTWVGLTDEERKELWAEGHSDYAIDATQAKLKEKNNG